MLMNWHWRLHEIYVMNMIYVDIEDMHENICEWVMIYLDWELWW
jgi:hypothetical protein